MFKIKSCRSTLNSTNFIHIQQKISWKVTVHVHVGLRWIKFSFKHCKCKSLFALLSCYIFCTLILVPSCTCMYSVWIDFQEKLGVRCTLWFTSLIPCRAPVHNLKHVNILMHRSWKHLGDTFFVCLWPQGYHIFSCMLAAFRFSFEVSKLSVHACIWIFSAEKYCSVFINFEKVCQWCKLYFKWIGHLAFHLATISFQWKSVVDVYIIYNVGYIHIHVHVGKAYSCWFKVHLI